jgi:hypothetical protein
MVGMYYSAEYEWNPHPKAVRPKGTIPSYVLEGILDGTGIEVFGEKDPNRYVVRVGDICFNLIGMIVNRKFQSVRYQPSGMFVVNSPVFCTDLRNAVREEWGQLTREQLCASLVSDVACPLIALRAISALEMLAQAYPDAMLKAVIQRLRVPKFDSMRVEVVADALCDEPSAAVRQATIAEFLSANGPAYIDGLVCEVWRRTF